MTVNILDVRSERDFNLFHLKNAHRVDPAEVGSPEFMTAIKQVPEGTIFFLVSNDDRDATRAYKTLRSAGLVNLYIVDGGINHWLDVFGIDPCVATAASKEAKGDENLRYAFSLAVGDNTRAAHPGCPCKDVPVICEQHHETEVAGHHDDHAKPAYTPKVKLQKKSKPHGGCG